MSVDNINKSNDHENIEEKKISAEEKGGLYDWTISLLSRLNPLKQNKTLASDDQTELVQRIYK